MAVSPNLSSQQTKIRWMSSLNRIFKKCTSYSPLVIFSDYLAEILSKSFHPNIPPLIILKENNSSVHTVHR